MNRCYITTGGLDVGALREAVLAFVDLPDDTPVEVATLAVGASQVTEITARLEDTWSTSTPA